MSNCCSSDKQQDTNSTKNNSTQPQSSDCCETDKGSIDWLLWGGSSFVALAFIGYWFQSASDSWVYIISATTVEMLDAMWIGMLLGVVIVGWLSRLPRDLIIATIGKGQTTSGIFRATMAGLLFDLCNHGILMVGMKLYERGASIGQVMAFIIASPWNSFTLTFILIGLIGWQWTLCFIAFSLVIAWTSGIIFDRLAMSGVIPQNENLHELTSDFSFKETLAKLIKEADYTPKSLLNMFINGFKDSRMVFRWVFVGIVLVALVRAFVPPESFNLWFGATASGLFLTLIAATIIEVCSEGSTPIAADLITRASAPGNSFTFLMAGASTDYTEIMVLKDTTKSWKIALFLPLITVPQVLLIGWIMNTGFA
jgi:uncharacterized protein